MNDERIEYTPELRRVDSFVDEAAEDFSKVDEPGADPLVTASDGTCAIPTEGLVVVYGSEGAGKTTVVLDWMVHFGAGRSWHGVLHPARELRIHIVENEGPRPEFRRKFRRRLAFPPGSDAEGQLRVLREPWAAVDLRDERHRTELAALIAKHATDILVAGPLFSLGMIGGGTADEITEFSRLLFDVRARSGRPVTFHIVHHTNNAGRVSGAWGPRPDMLVQVTAQESRHVRVWWEKVKWSSVLHKTYTYLTWGEGETFELQEREPVTDERIWEEIAAYVLANGGCGWGQASNKTVVSGNDTDKRKIRDRMLEDGVLGNLGKQRRDGKWDFKLWHRDDPTAPSEVRPDSAGLPDGLAASPGDGGPNVSPAVRPSRSEAGLLAGPTLALPGDSNAEPWSGPLIDDPRYLPWLFEQFERGELTEDEWSVQSRLHRDLAAGALEVE